MEKVKIIIADDHPLFRAGVRTELENVSHFEIIAESGNGEEALNLIQNLNPDIAILDFQMPYLTGLEIMQKLDRLNNNTQFILLTMHRDKKIFYRALDTGVKGYVLKDDAVTDIIKAVDDVIAGRYFISSSLAGLLLEKVKSNTVENEIHNLINSLTSNEKKILSLIAELKSNEEIASVLFISKRTVENYKVTLAGKLQLKSSRDILKFALQNKNLIME